jgi:hypothetical protein
MDGILVVLFVELLFFTISFALTRSLAFCQKHSHNK